MDSKLQSNAVTNPWIGAYQIYGAPWTTCNTFKEHFKSLNNDNKEKNNITEEANQEDTKDKTPSKEKE